MGQSSLHDEQEKRTRRQGRKEKRKEANLRNTRQQR
jgi:hypothetical protein